MNMKPCFAFLSAVLAKTVAGQSAVTVTEPAPSAPSPAQPSFSVSIISAQPSTSASVVTSLTTVFASPNPPPAPSSSVSGGGGSAGGGSSGGNGSGSGGICGLGYTYCGYILRDHQGFAEADIVRAYCGGAAENCASGTPKTDPIKALYICVPQNAQPRRKRQGPQPSAGGGGGGDTGTGPNGCSSTPGPGNKLELLCSCGGECLNPNGDHIGRCDKPCS